MARNIARKPGQTARSKSETVKVAAGQYREAGKLAARTSVIQIKADGSLSVPSEALRACNLERGTCLRISTSSKGILLTPEIKDDPIGRAFGVLKPKLGKSSGLDGREKLKAEEPKFEERKLARLRTR